MLSALIYFRMINSRIRLGITMISANTAPAVAGKSRITPYISVIIVRYWGSPTISVPTLSPREPMNACIVATAIPGQAMGRVTEKNVRTGPAPTSRAASSCCRCTARNAELGSQTMNIMELIIWMMTTPKSVPIRLYL